MPQLIKSFCGVAFRVKGYGEQLRLIEGSQHNNRIRNKRRPTYVQTDNKELINIIKSKDICQCL